MAEKPRFRYTFTVPEESIDFNGHVGNVTYLQWMTEAATRHADAMGWGMAACLDAGATWVAKRHCIDYLRPAFAGETLRIETWLEKIEKVRALRRYEIYRDGDDTLLAKGESEWIYVDAQTLRPRRIPEAMAEAFGGGDSF
ncbi:acyl-CoA thioesterase [Hydrogenimonas sp.]